MTSDPNRAQPLKSEVSAAVVAMLKARAVLFPSAITPPSVPKLSLRRPEGFAAPAPSAETPSDVKSLPASYPNPPVHARPTPEAIEAAQEAALAAFPEDVRTAARSAFEDVLLRAQGKVPAQTPHKEFARPSPIPPNLPQRRPHVEVPPFPAAGLDDPEVRAEWTHAHLAAAEARFLLQPTVLRAYAEAQLACEKWESIQRGRKPSGDLRYPVPRDRLQRIILETTRRHERDIAGAASIINSIETGDLVGVEFFDSDSPGYERSHRARIPMLVLQSDLDRKAAEQRARANRTREEIEADDAKWDEMVEELLAELPPGEPELVIPNLPDLPIGREPTASEVASFSNAIRKHLNYLERGEQIEAKRKREAATKVRTSAKREAERADPAGTVAANKAVKLSKAAERQRRWRERKMVRKDTDT